MTDKNPDAAPNSDSDQVRQNIDAVQDFYARAELDISHPQRILERISGFTGRPIFLGVILLFVLLWMLVNIALPHVGLTGFDPPPFVWLQGMVGLGSLLTATVVVTKQNRLAKLAQQRAHLDLKINLLTEQKTAKLIDLLEELRRDLPNVKDRHDPQAAALKKSMDADGVIATLVEHGKPGSPGQR